MATAGRLNIVNLAREGVFSRDGAVTTSAADVDAIFAHLRQRGDAHLLLYFHGGRVSEGDGKASADALMDLFERRVGAHPVFFIWESSEWEIVRHNLDRVGADALFRTLLDAV